MKKNRFYIMARPLKDWESPDYLTLGEAIMEVKRLFEELPEIKVVDIVVNGKVCATIPNKGKDNGTV